MVVNKSTKELDNSQMALTITVDAASIETAYEKLLTKYAKDIQLKGFRKGKAPLSLLESKFGEGIREESTFACLEEHLKEAIDTLETADRPLPYSTPVLQDEETLLPFKKNAELTFTVHYDVLPKFELPEYKGLEVSVDEVKIAKADVDKEIMKLREQNAMVISKSGKIAKGDIVTLNYVELDEKGEEVAGTSRADFTFTVGSSYNYYSIDEEIVGMAKDEEKEIKKTYAEDAENSELAGKSITLLVKINEVKMREIPELDDEFAQDVKEEYKTVKDLTDATKARMVKEVEDKQKNDKIDALMKALVEKTTINVPSSMVETEVNQNWNRFVKQSGLEENQLLGFFQMQGQSKESIMKEWEAPATENIKQQLILDAIKRKEDFKVDEAKFAEVSEAQLKGIEDEATKKYYEEMLKDDMQFEMVVPFLLDNNKFVTGKKISYEDFLAASTQQ